MPEPVMRSDDSRLQVEPMFRGGDINFFGQWVATQVEYPEQMMEEGAEGVVRVRFVVGADGRTGKIEVLESFHEAASEEVVRVIESSPRWVPGSVSHRVDGSRSVPVKIVIPVVFNLPKDPRKVPFSYTRGDTIYYATLPTFRGGNLSAFSEWLRTQVQFRRVVEQMGSEGRVEAWFAVDADGNVETAGILSSPHEAASEEVLRILESSPRWEPGRAGVRLRDGTVLHDQSIEVRITVPVNFRLPKAP